MLVGRSILPRLPETAPTARRVWRATVRLVQGLYIHDALDVASGMAFHFFLSLLPLLVVLGYILGHFIRQRGVEVLMDPILEVAPDAAMGLVRKELERLGGSTSSPIAPIGVVGFLWLASSGIHGLMNVFEIAVGAQRRPWWQKRLLAIGWVLGTIVVAAVAGWGLLELDSRFRLEPPAEPATSVPAPSVSGSVTEHGLHAVRPTHAMVKRRMHRILQKPSERAAALGFGMTLMLCGLAAFYRFSVKHPPGVKRRAWPGAFAAMSVWLLVSWGFGEYVGSLGKYALFYGSLAAVAVLLFWFYLTSLALLVGAELNAQLEGVRDNE
jgi:membrane protein